MNTSIRFKTVFQLGSVLALAAVLIFSTGCSKTEDTPTAQDILDQVLANVDQAQLNSDLAVIDDSLDTWGLADMIQIGPAGVRILIDSLGSGPMPTLENIIQINYNGKLLATGETFDSNQNASFNLFNLIAGFQTAMPTLPEGTKATLFIPSGLGYGSSDATDNAGNVIIPGNSNLIFDIELLTIF